MKPDSIVTVRGLTKSFDGRPVLKGLGLEIAQGRIHGLLGNNGAGKTTAINIITGLLAPDSGTIERRNRTGFGEWNSQIGVAPQQVAVYTRLTCAENIAFFGGLYGLGRRQLKLRVDEMIDLAQLWDYRNVQTSKLSGGMRRRLNLAVALAHNPTLLILDEPTAGLDVEARYSLWSVIRNLRTSGTAVLLTTHLLDEAAALCDSIAILHDGRIEREGTLDELLRTVPALQIAEIESDEKEAVRNRAAELGLGVRRYGGRLTLFLNEETTLETLVQKLTETGVSSISLRSVSLEDVFFDVTGGAAHPFAT